MFYEFSYNPPRLTAQTSLYTEHALQVIGLSKGAGSICHKFKCTTKLRQKVFFKTWQDNFQNKLKAEQITQEGKQKGCVCVENRGKGSIFRRLRQGVTRLPWQWSEVHPTIERAGREQSPGWEGNLLSRPHQLLQRTYSNTDETKNRRNFNYILKHLRSIFLRCFIL